MSAADRWLARGLALYALFIVYGSLVPLQWRPMPVADAWQLFLALPLPRWGASAGIDAAVNFLLTLPLAAGLAHLVLGPRPDGASGRGAGARRKGVLPRALLLAVALCSLSLGIEFAQVFFPPRSPSWSDVVAQWCGSLTGLVLHALFGGRFAGTLHVLGAHRSWRNRATQWLVLWLVGMLLFSLMPLDLTLMPVEVYRKWRDGRVILVPFAALAGMPAAEAVYAVLTDILLWVPVGFLWRVDGRQLNARQVVVRGLMAAAVIECLQLPVVSRVSDVTDVLLAGLGVALGSALPRRLQPMLAAHASVRRHWLHVATAVWLVCAVLLLWWPFDFDLARVSAMALAEAFLRMPFMTYYGRGEFGALNEILRKLLVFLPGGLLLGAAAAQSGSTKRGPLLGLAALAFVLEAGQVALPGRVADLTDAGLGCLGAWLGWRIARAVGSGGVDAAAAPYWAQSVASGEASQVQPRAGAPIRSWLATTGLVLVLLAGLVWLLGRVSGLPYNIAKLMPPGPAGVVAAWGLALALWWMLAAPLLLLWPQRRAWLVGFVAPGIVHGLCSFLLLRVVVPLPMLHKIIGTPVLGWGGPWEDMGRYLALHLSVMLPLFGAMLLVQTVWRPAAVVGLIAWVFAVLALFGPLHWVVVVQAGTDNLVELMRGGGGLGPSTMLASALGAGTAAGSAVSLCLAQAERRRPLLILVGVCTLLFPWLAMAGLETQLLKYERSFSALQFLLSASREQYATGAELVWRAAVAGLAGVLTVAVLQWPLWRALAASRRFDAAR